MSTIQRLVFSHRMRAQIFKNLRSGAAVGLAYAVEPDEGTMPAND